jgi:predicted secreted protein
MALEPGEKQTLEDTMLTKLLTTAIVSGLIATAVAPVTAYARDGAGLPFARMHNPDGSTVTSRGRRDGARVETHRNKHGKVVKRVPHRKPIVRKGKRRSVPWASSYDRHTGTSITAIGNGNGTRTVITFGFGGFGIHISR